MGCINLQFSFCNGTKKFRKPGFCQPLFGDGNHGVKQFIFTWSRANRIQFKKNQRRANRRALLSEAAARSSFRLSI